MNGTKMQIISSMFAFVPYVLVTWGYTVFTGGGMNDFWKTLGFIFAVRAFFGMIETIGGILAWRIYGKKKMVHKFVKFLRNNNFPMREYAHDDLGNYLARLDDEEKYNQAIRHRANEVSRSRELAESMGIFPSMRYESAWDAALEIYSPKERAPHLDA